MSDTPSLDDLWVEVTGLWPKWDPTDVQRRTWLSLLRRLQHRDLAMQAIHAAYGHKRPGHDPTWRDIQDGYNQLAQRDAPPAAKRARIHPLFSVMCTEPPEGRPGYAGRYFGVHGRLDRPDLPRDVAFRKAVDLADQHVKAYGGTWDVLEDYSANDLARRSIQLWAQFNGREPKPAQSVAGVPLPF